LGAAEPGTRYDFGFRFGSPAADSPSGWLSCCNSASAAFQPTSAEPQPGSGAVLFVVVASLVESTCPLFSRSPSSELLVASPRSSAAASRNHWESTAS